MEPQTNETQERINGLVKAKAEEMLSTYRNFGTSDEIEVVETSGWAVVGSQTVYAGIIRFLLKPKMLNKSGKLVKSCITGIGIERLMGLAGQKDSLNSISNKKGGFRITYCIRGTF